MTTALLKEFGFLVDREWARIAAPGTWWSGHERVAIATEARYSRGSSQDLTDAAIEAAGRVAADAASIRADDVRRWAEAGLDGFAYVELVGIVARLAAIDVASLGLGVDERPLPSALPGEPSRIKPEEAAITTGWAPTIGPAGAPGCLSAVPAELDAMFDVHNILYLSMVEMADLDIVRDGVHRAQMEVTAARTSWLNECFY